MFLFFLNSFHIYTLLGLRSESMVCDVINTAAPWPLVNMGKYFIALSESFKRKKGKTIGAGICGLILSLVAVSVIGGLLIEADQAFAEITMILKGTSLDEIKIHILYFIFGVPFSIIAYGMLMSGRLGHGTKPVKYKEKEQTKILPFAFAYTFFIPVFILYLIYILSQGAYLFSVFSSLLPYGFSYSGYARRGFFELCAIVTINASMLVLLNTFVKEDKGTSFRKFTNVFLCLISELLIATAIAKMVMYVDFYGLSVKRFYTTLFMATLAVVFFIILLSGFVKKINLVKILALFLTTVIILSSYVDVDKLTAWYNLKAYTEERIEEFDMDMFMNMSDSATPYIIDYFKSKGSATNEDYLNIENRYHRAKNNVKSLTGFNFSSLEALKATEAYCLE
ncbi:MAG: DUF4173 domain-containing protein [Clostridiales bacterium]|nr:DUF4173 domain-containing protein [Clostridiales bacterium]